MNTKPKHRIGKISTLVGGILLILVFFPRGAASHILLVCYVSIWLAAILVLRISSGNNSAEANNSKGSFFSELFAASDEDEITDAAIVLLLEHVHGRITERLQAVYPKASWEYLYEQPEDEIFSGGMAQLKLKDAGDFKYAVVSFENPERLEIEMVRTEPLSISAQEKPATIETLEQAPKTDIDCEPKKEPAKETRKKPAEREKTIPVRKDPAEEAAVWYSLIGQKALTDLITDLNVRGFHRLRIEEDGSVLITEKDKNETKETTLDRMPRKELWPHLISALEEQGLSASQVNDQLAIDW